MGRILLAAVLGGLLMFAWAAVEHMLTPIGDAGISMRANSPETLAALKAGFPEGGMFGFPGTDGDPKDPKVMDAMFAAAAKGPSGLLVIQPNGEVISMPKLLTVEFVSNVLCALVAALLVAGAALRSFGGRLLLVTGIGLAAWLSISVSLWNWYSFPTSQTLAQLADQVGGFFFAGLPIAALVKPAAR